MTRITQTFHKIAEIMPLGLYKSLVKRDFIVLNYHMVSDQKRSHVHNLFAYKTPDMFEQDLLYLQRHFDLVSYDQLFNHVIKGKKIPKKAISLTFDDGLAECYSVVRPMLLHYGIPCTFFVNTSNIDNLAIANEQKVSLCIDRIRSEEDSNITIILRLLQDDMSYGVESKQSLIDLLRFKGIHNHELVDRVSRVLEMDYLKFLRDQKPYLTIEQIRSMHVEGFTIGSHGSEHIQFSSLTDLEIERSMADSCKQISALTGKTAVPFAFPHNADGLSRKLLSQILINHPNIGLLFDSNGIRFEERFLISRINGDRFHKGEEKKSNLSVNIKKAYYEEIASNWIRRKEKTR